MVRNIAGLLMSVGHGESPPGARRRGAREPRPQDQCGDRATRRAVPRRRALPGRVRAAGYGERGCGKVPLLSSAALRLRHHRGSPPDMSWFEKIMPSRIKTERRTRSVPEGLWIKCSACDAVLYRAELERNLNVCPKCSHHMRIGGRERLGALSRRRRAGRRSAPTSRPKIRSSFATASVTATASPRRRRPPASATR